MNLIESIKNGTFDFAEEIKELYHAIRDAEWMKSGIDFLKGVWELLPYAILLGIAVLLLFLGKKMMGVWKFFGLFVIGYAASVRYLVDSEVIPEDFFIPGWIVALVIGILAAVLFKYLYWLLVAGAGFGAGYALVLALGGKIASLGSWMESGSNKLIATIAGGAVVMILVLLLIKWVEMLGTSAFGALLIAYIVNTHFFAFTNSLSWGEVELPVVGAQAISLLVVAGVLFLFGAFVQIKTRRRY